MNYHLVLYLNQKLLICIRIRKTNYYLLSLMMVFTNICANCRKKEEYKQLDFDYFT